MRRAGHTPVSSTIAMRRNGAVSAGEENRLASVEVNPEARQKADARSSMAADDSFPLLTLQLFGPFEARVHGDPVPQLRFRKGQWVLALLALRAGRVVERDWLAGLLWPDRTETPALT